jgi:hypothetical protein
MCPWLYSCHPSSLCFIPHTSCILSSPIHPRNHSVTSSLPCMFHLQHHDTAQPRYPHDISYPLFIMPRFWTWLTLLGLPSRERQFATRKGWFLYRNLHGCVSHGQEFPEPCRGNLKLLTLTTNLPAPPRKRKLSLPVTTSYLW